MFKSSLRPIVFPQSEHLKLVGTLAFLWGNSLFDIPPLPRLSVAAGIGLHDRAYGYLDNLPIGEVDDETWLPLTRGGFYMLCTDPVADIITRHHLLRLVSGGGTPAHQALAEEMRAALQQQMSLAEFDPVLFQRIDRLTNFCDRVSFDFCREKPLQNTLDIYPRCDCVDTIAIRYEITGSEIFLDPWPLSVPEYHGYLVSYAQDGYPERLDARLAPFHIHQG